MKKLAVSIVLVFALALGVAAAAEAPVPATGLAPDGSIKKAPPGAGVKKAVPAKARAGLNPPADPVPQAPKMTAAEKRDKAKLDHDLKICIGC
jgi:hypothetical protein